MLKIHLLAACLALAGCAASQHHLGTQALNKGDLRTAEAQLAASIKAGNVESWNNLGVVYARSGRREQAVRAYQMAARYGDPLAQKNLVDLGQSVPAADLKASGSSAADGWGTALKAFDEGKNPSRCSSIVSGMLISTTCR